ncbi:MAG: PAS domain-containing sensor histidine kinase [Bacteroidales bacterium]|nr:PAS domain-containing sensor histidine kinase [Bacteroidales bacterium]
MNIDIQTLILIIGISHLMQVLVFYYQYIANKFIKGPGWWLMWSVAESFGFGLILLRSIPLLHQLVIAFQNVIIFSGTILIYIGVLEFFSRKINLKFILLFFSSFVALHLSFLFIKDDIYLRTLFLNVFLSATAFLTAITILKNKTSNIASTANFSVILFSLHGSVFVYRTIVLIINPFNSNIFAPTFFNLTQYFDALIIGLLWTFGFIIMLNQRLNLEIYEAKSHFEQIFSTSPDAALITRLKDGMLVDCNENFTKIFGYSKDDILGKTTLDINFWKTPKDRQELVRIIKENGVYENCELLFQRKDGEVITGLMSAKAITLKGIPHIISVTRNISDRKHVEEILKESEQRLQYVLQGSHLGFWDWNLVTNKVKRNEQWAEMLGYKIDEIEFTVKQWIDFVHHEDQAMAMKSIQDHVKGITPMHRLEYRMRTKSGQYKWILDQGQAVAWDSNHQVIRMSGTHIDVTERKQAEIAMQESEKRYRLLFQNLSSGFALHEIILDSNGKPCDYRFLEINPAFETLTGLKATDLIGKTILEVLPNTEFYWIETYGRVALTGKPLTLENYSIEFNKYYHVNAYSPEEGKFATIFHDISDQKLFEVELQNKNEELIRVNADKDRFMSILAHDLKSPFNTILGYLNLLTENIHEYDIDKIEKQIAIINNSAQNTYFLMEDILLWARSKSGKIPFEPKEFKFNTICKDIIEILTPNANTKNITINYNENEEIVAFADADMLKTILRNLISNAIKFTNKGGNVNVTVNQSIKRVSEFNQNNLYIERADDKYNTSQIISVADNGIGITPELKDKLFDVIQAYSTKGTTNEVGTGLGLSLCKEFVEKHGGSIWVESELGKGSTFYFTLAKNSSKILAL